MLTDGRLKYVSRLLGGDELYDLETDPTETVNLIDRPEQAAAVADLQLKLLKWLQTTADIVPFDQDQRFTREMLLAKGRAVAGPGHDAEILTKIQEGVGIGELIRYCLILGGAP